MTRTMGCVLLACLFFIALALSAAQAEWIDAGPIWNDFDAQRRCPQVCGSAGWDGNWKTTQPGRNSVCSCRGRAAAEGRGRKYQVDAGPIFHNLQAERICTAACGSARWDGNWRIVGGRSTWTACAERRGGD